MKTYSDYGIDLKSSKIHGEVSCICPQCSHDRKKKTVKCLSVNLDKKVWMCSHCGWKGGIPKEFVPQIKDYKRPVWQNKTELSDKVVQWFEKRGINQQTLKHFNISEGMEWMPQKDGIVNTIQFNYFRNDELINTKYRTADKSFKLYKDAELIFYNIDCLKDAEEVYIVEGEMDCLAMYQAGVINTISVPNGANLNTNNMQYIDNCIELFDHIQKIHIATDNDMAGRKLREEISLRFGKDRCDFIIFKDCKDANDCLLKYNYTGIQESISEKIEFPIDGVFGIQDYSDEIDDYYINGLPEGAKIGMDEFDKLISFHKGYITTVTGVPSHGKSEWVDQMTLKLRTLHDWKGAFYSPENKPTKLHFAKMAQRIIGKFWSGLWRMTESEKDLSKAFLEDYVWFIKPERDFTLQTILDSVKRLKTKKGLDYFVIDAFNKLEHKDDSSNYIGRELDKLSDFCELNDVHCFLVAHPTKMRKKIDGKTYEVPTLYDIAGSANFFNKTDVGLCVYRDFETDTTFIMVQKVKFRHWGQTGTVEMKYDTRTGRYFELGSKPDTSNWVLGEENWEEKPQNTIAPHKEQEDIFNTPPF